MADPTLDEMRAVLAAALPQHAAFDGWTPAALALAAQDAGIDPAVATLAFPGGAADMIDAWFGTVDAAMLAACPADMLAPLKVRERVRRLAETRLEIVAADMEALRRALALLALPQNLPRAARLDWRAADAMWHAAGDRATDFNHYSKRILLGGIYAATVIAMLDDTSEGLADTRAFLARRIDGIMRFEKIKARLSSPKGERLSLARFFGRLRYPAV